MPSYTWWVTPQSSAKLNVFWSYIAVVSYISVAFVIFKLYISKCFWGDAASKKWPSLWSFCAFSFPNMAQFIDILTRGSLW